MPVRGVERHRLEAGHFERRVDRSKQPTRRREDPAEHPLQHVHDVAGVERAVPGQQAIERRAQAINVAGRPDPIELAGGLLGAHVLRRPQRRAGAGQRRRVVVGQGRTIRGIESRGRRRLWRRDRLGEPPVDHEGFAEPAEHDVVGLEVAVDDAAAVRVGDRVAGVDQAAEQPAEGDLAPGRLAAPPRASGTVRSLGRGSRPG